jgi:crossover junction endodeoxyribonuclease RusA
MAKPKNIWKSVFIELPLLPPTVNHYVKHTRTGRHYVTGEAKAFKEAIALASRGRTLEFKYYTVAIGIGLGPGEKGDIDNFAKVCLDGLRDALVITTDARVTRLEMNKFRLPDNCTRILVTEGPEL